MSRVLLISAKNNFFMKKLFSLKKIGQILDDYRKDNIKTVLVTGCFDVIHYAHIKFFQYAKQLGDKLIVGLENDESIRLNKSANRPFFDFEKRVIVLSEIESIDYIFKMKEVTKFNNEEADKYSKKLLLYLRPDIFAVNAAVDSAAGKKKAICKDVNVKFKGDTALRIVSSTRLIENFLHFYK